MHRADSRFVPSQYEMSLQSNAISHWLGTNLESALMQDTDITFTEGAVLSTKIVILSHCCLVSDNPYTEALFGLSIMVVADVLAPE